MAKPPEKPVSDTVKRLMEDEKAVKEANDAARAKTKKAVEEATAKKSAYVAASHAAIAVGRNALTRWRDDLRAGKFQGELDVENAIPVHGTQWTRFGIVSFFRPANRTHVYIAFGTTEDMNGLNGEIALLASAGTHQNVPLKVLKQWPIEQFNEAVADGAIKSVIDSLLLPTPQK